MGLSNRHWRPPLTPEDFEFEQGRLVKIRGQRPMYMDGYALIAALEYMTELYLVEKTRADKLYADLVEIAKMSAPPNMIIQTGVGEPVVITKFELHLPRSPDADPGGDSNVE